MNEEWKKIIWNQFGASIDMLGNAIDACPEEVWDDRRRDFSSYWYVVSHALFWLDYYLSNDENFAPPEPFGFEELDPAGVIPERTYTKDELRNYLNYCREKCRATIENLNEENINKSYKFGWGEMNFTELLLYNMRHVQHHAAQLNLILRQKTDSAPGWIGRAK
jgi:hypothetical protein